MLSKEVVDHDGELMLEALGILGIWILNRASPAAATNRRWLPIFERVAACEAASEAVVTYLISFHEKCDLDQAAKTLLQKHLAYLTATTVWLLSLEDFWLLKTQMLVRLKASLTVSDCFEGSISKFFNFAACIQSPKTLSDVWLKAVIRSREPLTWIDVKTDFFDVLKAIKSDSEVLLVEEEHLLDWQ